MSKKLDKYILTFQDIVLSGGISIISFASIIGDLVGIASGSFSLIFSLTAEIIRKLLKTTRNKKKKYNKIVMRARRILNIIETLTSQALKDPEISDDEYKTIINEEENYRKLEENIIMINGIDELNEKEDKRLKAIKL